MVNAGNGAAGHVVDALENVFQQLNAPVTTFIKFTTMPTARSQMALPKPLLPENRADTRNAVLAHNADMGIAWDGDFDRCFLLDADGRIYRRLLHCRFVS